MSEKDLSERGLDEKIEKRRQREGLERGTHQRTERPRDAGDPRSPGGGRGQGDPERDRPDGGAGGDPRPDGTERLRQVDPVQHHHGPPRLRGDRRRRHLQGREDHRAHHGSASQAGSVPRAPVPDRGSRRERRELPADRVSGGEGRADQRARVPQAHEGADGSARHRGRDGPAVREPGILGGREEAERGPPARGPAAGDRDPGRDRLGPRHRLAEAGRRRAWRSWSVPSWACC